MDNYEFPPVLPIKDLRVHHPEYDADEIENYRLIYEGGKAFRNKIDRFLVKRQIEKSGVVNGIDGNAHWKARCERAWYVARGPGLIDFMVASVFKDLRLSAPNDSTGFYERLNTNADGKGTNLVQIMRDALRNDLLYGRGYLSANFSREYGEDSPVQIAAPRADLLDDWNEDDDGTAPVGPVETARP
jgi:hypothetical protein